MCWLFNLTQPDITLVSQALHYQQLLWTINFVPGTGAGVFPHDAYCHSTPSFSSQAMRHNQIYSVLSPALDWWVHLFKGIATSILLVSSFHNCLANFQLSLFTEFIMYLWGLSLAKHLTFLPNDFYLPQLLDSLPLSREPHLLFHWKQKAISICFPHHALLISNLVRTILIHPLLLKPELLIPETWLSLGSCSRSESFPFLFLQTLSPLHGLFSSAYKLLQMGKICNSQLSFLHLLCPSLKFFKQRSYNLSLILCF